MKPERETLTHNVKGEYKLKDNTAVSSMGSDAAMSTLDWSHIRETVRFLNLAVAHIEDSMSEGDESVEALTDSFTTMAGIIQMIEHSFEEQTDSVSADLKDAIAGSHCLHDKVHSAIIAFQFYDRLVQKLSHVNHSLEALSNLIGDKTRLFNPHEWMALQEKIRSRYTMESERLMFDALMRGRSVQEALQEAARYEHSAGSEHGDIDLF